METKSKKAKAKSATRKAVRIAEGNLLDQWKSLAATAYEQRLDEAELLMLFAKGRDGDQTVKSTLVNGTMYLVYEAGFAWTSKSSRRRFEDIYGSLALGHDKAITNLLDNDRVDIVKAISDTLTRRIKNFAREQSPTIFEKPSTKTRRKQLNLPAYRDLTRTGAHLSDKYVEGETFVLPKAADHKAPFTDQTRRRYVPPSKYHSVNDDFALVDLLDEFKDGSWEQQVAMMLFEGKTQATIVEETGATEYAVAKAVAAVKETLRPYWNCRDNGSDVDLDDVTPPMLSTLPEKFDDASVAPAELELSISV